MCLNSEVAALFACSLTGYLQCNTQVVLLEKCSRKETMLSIKSSSIQPTINNLPYHVHSLLANCNKDTFGAKYLCSKQPVSKITGLGISQGTGFNCFFVILIVRYFTDLCQKLIYFLIQKIL